MGRREPLPRRVCGNWSPSGDTGEAAGLSDRSCRLPAQQGAGCACAARKEAGEHRAASEGFPRFARCRWRRPACPQSPPSQRARSRRHKPPNGAPEGVTLNYPIRGTAGAPSDQPMTPRLAKPGRDGSHGNRFFEKRSRATGTTFLLPLREKKQNQHLSFS